MLARGRICFSERGVWVTLTIAFLRRLRVCRLAVPAALVGLALSGLLVGGEEQPPKEKTPTAKPIDEAQPLDKEHAAKMAKGLELFKTHVRPVLIQNCVKCHGGPTIESEFDLTDRAALLRGGSSGKVAEPGRAKAGRLYERITHAKEPGMPLKGEKLSNEDRKS